MVSGSGRLLASQCCRLSSHLSKLPTWHSARHLPSLRSTPSHSSVLRSASTNNGPSIEPTARSSKHLAKQVLRQLALALGVVITGHAFLEHVYSFSPAEGISMLPTINSFGDWLVVSKKYRRGRGIVVGDVVSTRHPVYHNMGAAKRVIGMPGDLVVQGMPDNPRARMIQVPQGHCWIVGDNLLHSRDSRTYGPLPLALITGKVVAKIETGQGFLKLKASRMRNTLSTAE